MPVAAVVLLAVASGCVKQPLDHLSADDTKLYITNYDSTANFAAFKTFSVADSVAVIRNNKLTIRSLNPSDSAYIAAVSAQLQQRGYTPAIKGQADLGVSLNRITNSYTGVVSYDDYWGDYGGYWDPYYWGYPGDSYYGSYVGVYQITDGAMSIDVLDLKDAASTTKIKSVWSGLIRGENILGASNAAAGVQALFAQSPYFKTNQ
jgi:hypothetical protein